MDNTQIVELDNRVAKWREAHSAKVEAEFENGDQLLVAYQVTQGVLSPDWLWRYEVVTVECDEEGPIAFLDANGERTDLEWEIVEHWMPLSEFHLQQITKSKAR